MTLPRLRPYQAAPMRAILERVERASATAEGGVIVVEVARQGGKNELSAQLELLLLLARARRGGTIVKCAPTLVPQARLSRERLLQRARDAALDGTLRREGEHVRCGQASARFLSAEPSANVVGHTADVLLEVDEAQAVDAETFDRDFRPMAASTNAPTVYYGTPWGADSLLEEARHAAAAAERRDRRRHHFRYDWRAVAAAVPAYGRYVRGERDRLGERHPIFRSQYELEVIAEADRLLDAGALALLEGDYGRQREPRPGERYVAGLDLAGPTVAGDRDWTVLTLARVAPGEHGVTTDVVEHAAWHGGSVDALLDTLVARLRRWRVRRLAVDASGLGGPIADQLAARLSRGVVEPLVFTADRKSRLGFGLLAAAHSGRLHLYASDGSSEAVACRRQLALARAHYRSDRAMQFDVDPRRDHDDYLMSLALCVEAARLAGAPRVAVGVAAARRDAVEAEPIDE